MFSIWVQLGKKKAQRQKNQQLSSRCFFPPQNGPLLAALAPVFLQDFPAQGDATLPQQWEKAYYRSFRQKCIVKDILWLDSFGSQGMRALGTQITVSTILFPSLQLWDLEIFGSINLRFHQNTVISLQNQSFFSRSVSRGNVVQLSQTASKKKKKRWKVILISCSEGWFLSASWLTPRTTSMAVTDL